MNAWQRDEHKRTFGKSIMSRNAFAHISYFQKYLPARCLNYVLNKERAQGYSGLSILDIGCAAGDFYAYLTYLPVFDKDKYRGLDVSIPAVELANSHYKTEAFNLITGDDDLEGEAADIVLSVDVFPHQVKPFDHLQRILGCANKYLVIALRTRDTGDTVLDPDLSCQLIYGEWVPWIVVNTKELYAKIFEFSGKPTRIISIKEYMILAGEGRRFLPKELYLEASGTALTTLIIDMGENITQNQITEYQCQRLPPPRFRNQVLNALLAYGIRELKTDGLMARLIYQTIRSIDDVLKYHNIISKSQVQLGALSRN